MGAVGTLSLESLAKDLRPRTIKELFAFIGVADKQDVDVSAKINEVFKQIGQVTEAMVVAAIEKRSASEFSAVASACFNDYVRVLRLKADFLRVVLRNDIPLTERLVSQSLSELEGEFRHHGRRKFGSSASEQAIFTVWTIRRTANTIWKLCDPEIINLELKESSKQKSETLSASFALYSAWAQFHLECMTTAMRLNRAVYPSVLPALMDGLRSEVNAYAIAKQMVDLYLPVPEETPDVPYAWDDEDDELLASSMQDLELEEI